MQETDPLVVPVQAGTAFRHKSGGDPIGNELQVLFPRIDIVHMLHFNVLGKTDMIRILVFRPVTKEHKGLVVHHADRNRNSVSHRIVCPDGEIILFGIKIEPLELAELNLIRINDEVVFVDVRQLGTAF